VNDVDPLFIISDFRDEAVFVASDVEDCTLPNRISVGKIAARLSQVRVAVQRRDVFPKTPAEPFG
jgi:hypothetical protein